jgi:segregation and condensation protein B
MELLKQQIEALIFCSEQSISLDEISASLKISFDWDLEDEEIVAAIEELKNKYTSEEYSFELVEISEGYQFLTKKEFHIAVSALIQHKAKKKLSVSQMETLAIIAYRQPVSKGEVEHIRGVSCDYAIQKLLEKELIEISGKSDGPGRPILYSTSRSFMDYFGIKSVKDLPQLKDLHMDQNVIGQPLEEEVLGESIAYKEAGENSDDETGGDTSESINIREEDAVESGVQEMKLETGDVRDEENWDLPDRKAIFLENEIETDAINEEEDTESNRPDEIS